MLTSSVNIRQSNGTPNGAAFGPRTALPASEQTGLEDILSTPVLTAPLTGIGGENTPSMPRFFDGSPLGAHQLDPTLPSTFVQYAVPNASLNVPNVGGESPQVPGAWGPMSPATGEYNPTYTGSPNGLPDTAPASCGPNGPNRDADQDPSGGANVPLLPNPNGTGHNPNPLHNVGSRMGLMTINCEESASTVLLTTVRVDITDPDFYTRMKFTYTVAQAAAAISRIDPHLFKNLKQASGKSGTKTGLAIEKFVDLVTRGHQTSVQLTVCLLVHLYTEDERHILYQRVQDAIAAWMMVHDAQLPLLVTHAMSGVIPEELLVRADLRLSNGMMRLQAHDPIPAFVHLYEFLYVTLSYEREGLLVHLKPIQDWKNVHKYRQQVDEQLMYALSRERMRFSAVVDGCRAANMTGEIPTTVARVTNLQGIVLRNLWHATERRIRYRDGHMLHMDMTALTHELMAQERRDQELMVTDTALTGSNSMPQKTRQQGQQRDQRDPREGRDSRNKPRHKNDSSPHNTSQSKPKSNTEKKCSNHPESTTHTTRECKHATSNGVCYAHIRNKSCTRGTDCAYSHDISKISDRDKRDAAEKEVRKKVRAAPTVAAPAPTEAEPEPTEYGSHLDKVDPAKCVTYADALTNVRVFPTVTEATVKPTHTAHVQWKDDRELFNMYKEPTNKTVLPDYESILTNIPENVEITMHAQEPTDYKPRWNAQKRQAAKNAELKPPITDAIKGPMAYATAVTRQGRQDGNHKGSNDTMQYNTEANDVDTLNALLDNDETFVQLRAEFEEQSDELPAELRQPADGQCSHPKCRTTSHVDELCGVCDHHTGRLL